MQTLIEFVVWVQWARMSTLQKRWALAEDNGDPTRKETCEYLRGQLEAFDSWRRKLRTLPVDAVESSLEEAYHRCVAVDGAHPAQLVLDASPYELGVVHALRDMLSAWRAYDAERFVHVELPPRARWRETLRPEDEGGAIYDLVDASSGVELYTVRRGSYGWHVTSQVGSEWQEPFTTCETLEAAIRDAAERAREDGYHVPGPSSRDMEPSDAPAEASPFEGDETAPDETRPTPPHSQPSE